MEANRTESLPLQLAFLGERETGKQSNAGKSFCESANKFLGRSSNSLTFVRQKTRTLYPADFAVKVFTVVIKSVG